MSQIQMLSKNQQIVLKIIEQAKEPLKHTQFYLMLKKKELKLHLKFIELLIN